MKDPKQDRSALPLFITITGSKVPARSRGTSRVTSLAPSVSTVFERVPLRMLSAPPVGAWCLGCPWWSDVLLAPRAGRTSSCTAALYPALTLEG